MEVGKVEQSNSVDEGMVMADIVVREAEIDEEVGADVEERETGPDEVDTGKAEEKMVSIDGVVVRAAADNYGAYKIVDMVEKAEIMFDEEERILATRRRIVGEAEKVFVDGEHILAMREHIVEEFGPTGDDWIAIVLARDEAVALVYRVGP